MKYDELVAENAASVMLPQFQKSSVILNRAGLRKMTDRECDDDHNLWLGHSAYIWSNCFSAQ